MRHVRLAASVAFGLNRDSAMVAFLWSDPDGQTQLFSAVLALAAICRNYDERQEMRVTEEDLRSIQAPVLGITGEHDIERPMLERMQGVVPQFTMKVLAGLGHTGPEFFSALAEESLRFLRSSGLRRMSRRQSVTG